MSEEAKPVIRTATPDDTYAIRKFHAASWLDTYPNDNAGVPESWVRERWENWDSPEKLQESRELVTGFIADPDQLYEVAVVNDAVVGFVHATRHKDDQELGALYVAREYQGTGLAAELMLHADAFWDVNRPVYLVVVDYNERAKRFYEKQGFKKVSGSDYMHADKMPSIKMRREPRI